MSRTTIRSFGTGKREGFRSTFHEKRMTQEMAPEYARRVGHPAPFPVELPLRLLKLYTGQGDVVLDSFMGSGTTAVAAVQGGRSFVGYDTSSEYLIVAERRLAEIRSRLLAAGSQLGS